MATCRRDVTANGGVIIQQHAPGWFATVADGENVRDGIIFRMRDMYTPGAQPGLGHRGIRRRRSGLDADVHGQVLDDTELAAVLAGAGLRLDRYLTEDRTWLRAVPER